MSAGCSLSRHHAPFVGIMSTKRCGAPILERAFLCFDKEENVHDRKAVAGICVEGFVIGHLPQEISRVCFHYIY